MIDVVWWLIAIIFLVMFGRGRPTISSHLPFRTAENSYARRSPIRLHLRSEKARGPKVVIAERSLTKENPIDRHPQHWLCSCFFWCYCVCFLLGFKFGLFFVVFFVVWFVLPFLVLLVVLVGLFVCTFFCLYLCCLSITIYCFSYDFVMYWLMFIVFPTSCGCFFVFCVFVCASVFFL